jgi:aldehyde reductase
MAATELLIHSIMISAISFQSPVGQVEQAVKIAIDAGYRHIDGAFVYQNEVEVGNAIEAKIAEGIIGREDLFVTSKLWNTFHDPEHVREAVEKSLKDLKLSYLDLYLMHFPMGFKYVNCQKLYPKGENGEWMIDDVDHVETWRAMEKLVDDGLVRSLGMSNFNTR